MSFELTLSVRAFQQNSFAEQNLLSQGPFLLESSTDCAIYRYRATMSAGGVQHLFFALDEMFLNRKSTGKCRSSVNCTKQKAQLRVGLCSRNNRKVTRNLYVGTGAVKQPDDEYLKLHQSRQCRPSRAHESSLHRSPSSCRLPSASCHGWCSTSSAPGHTQGNA